MARGQAAVFTPGRRGIPSQFEKYTIEALSVVLFLPFPFSPLLSFFPFFEPSAPSFVKTSDSVRSFAFPFRSFAVEENRSYGNRNYFSVHFGKSVFQTIEDIF